jgi:hypothetical protein
LNDKTDSQLEIDFRTGIPTSIDGEESLDNSGFRAPSSIQRERSESRKLLEKHHQGTDFG